MGTPFSIEIIEEGLEGNNRTMVSGGSNGFSNYVIPFLKRAYDFMVHWTEKHCAETPDIGRPEYFGYMRGRAKTVAAFLCATQPDLIFPDCHDCGPYFGGDQYRLFLVNRAKGTGAENPIWEVEVEKFRVPLEELAKRYGKQA